MTDQIGITPGHHPEITNDEYHASAGISKSMLDDIDGACPLKYWAKHVDPDREPEEKTEALVLGDAIHTAVLEPDLVNEHIIVIPGAAPKRPSKAQLNAKKPSPETTDAIAYWDDFNRRAQNKVVLNQDQFDMVRRMRDRVHAHPVVGPLLRGGRAEQSYYAIDPDTGALIKCRCDYLLADNFMVDFKTTEDASPEAFGRSAGKYRYDVQAGWYPEVYGLATGKAVEHFVFVAVEKEYPHATGCYYVEEETTLDDGVTVRQLDVARQMAHRDLRQIVDCTNSDVWPDYAAAGPQPLKLPRYMRRNKIQTAEFRP